MLLIINNNRYSKGVWDREKGVVRMNNFGNREISYNFALRSRCSVARYRACFGSRRS
jgi:hypothetical protein